LVKSDHGKSGNRPPEPSAFAETLADATQQDLKWSKHAQERMLSRQIQLSQQDKQKLSEAVEKVAQKGAKESLILMDQLAFLVNVKNRTVVTALDQKAMKDHIFTAIDAAMVVEGRPRFGKPTV
jgi:flagellar operon protein